MLQPHLKNQTTMKKGSNGIDFDRLLALQCPLDVTFDNGYFTDFLSETAEQNYILMHCFPSKEWHSSRFALLRFLFIFLPDLQLMTETKLHTV